jgi:hypothetical protein
LTVRRDTGGDYRIFALMVNAPGVVTISGLNITNGLASGSFPDDIGGGIANLASGTANISDCILSGNSANAGGAISSVRPDFDPAITTNVTNCVLSNNLAGEGGGIWNASTLTVTRSTLSGNTATTSGDGGGITQLTGDQIGVSAAQLKLGPLQDNGGATPTMAPQCGSVAIDKGIANSLSTDQRGAGFARTVDDPTIADAANGTDVGAFELQPTCGGPTPTDVTPPLITPSVSGTLGNNGWYTSAV